MRCAALGAVRAMQGYRGPAPFHPSHPKVCWKRGDGKHRNLVGARAEVLGWGARAGSPVKTRVPLRFGSVSRSPAPALGLDPAKTSLQLRRPASKVTRTSARGMPPLSQLGTYLSLPAPRGQALARSSTLTAAAGEAAGSLKAAIAAFVRQLWLGECTVRAPTVAQTTNVNS